MKQEMLRKLQMTELEILKDFDKICKKYGLTYFLEGGTLLGALRHQGFIPWDDDIDLIMPRKDYQELLKLYRKGLLKGYFFQCIETDPNYWNFFGKFRKEGTIFVTEEEKDIDSHQGIFVDIFPIDLIEKESWRLKLADQIQPFIRSVLIRRAGMLIKDKNKKKEKMWKTISFLLSPFSNSFLQKIGMMAIPDKKKKTGKFYFRPAISKEDAKINRVCPIDKINPKGTLVFEGYEFPVIKDYQWQLEVTYGKNYMQLPPECDRVTHGAWKLELGDN